MELSARTKIDDLLTAYPYLMDFFINLSPKYKALQNPVMRGTIGKVATLQQVASIGGFEVDDLVARIGEVVREHSGDAAATTGGTGTGEASAVQDPAARLEILKDIIKDLHAGQDMAVLRKRFEELIKDIDYQEIAQMEQKLIAEGLPETEIKRLCDVHVQVFKDSLDRKDKISAPLGHPVHTFMLENRVAEKLIAKMQDLLGRSASPEGRAGEAVLTAGCLAEIEKLLEINLHYLRKENQLFPVLERHGITGPSTVMWAIHDDIRQMLKESRQLLSSEGIGAASPKVKETLKAIQEMIYKEENVLFPMAMQTLTEEEWYAVRKGEEEIGYAWVVPMAEYGRAGGIEDAAPSAEASGGAGLLGLNTGKLSLEQIDLVLTHLPVDISFVDENDEVKYYSGTKERIFPRSPGVIGRKVQNCHPQKSMHMVQRILDEFRAGTKDVAEFWIEMKGRFIHIRYFAVRDGEGVYRGTLEVSQDVTGIRKLEGQKRLLDWD